MSTPTIESSRRPIRRAAVYRQRVERGIENHTPPASALGHDAGAKRARELTRRQFTAWG
jgi:hypothetical protein